MTAVAVTPVGAAGGVHEVSVVLEPAEEQLDPHAFVSFTKQSYAVLPVNPDTVDAVAEDIPDVTVLIPEPTGVPEHVPPLATQNVSILSTVDPLTAVHDNANETPPPPD